MFLTKIIKELNKNDIPYALVGGYAVGLHGAVRGTMDVDIILKWSLPVLRKLEKVLIDMGLQSRLPISADDIFNFKDEYINNRNLIAWNFYNPIKPSEQLDIVITHDLSGMKIKRVRHQQMSINVLSKEDLIQMKKESGRQQDLLDIEALKKI